MRNRISYAFRYLQHFSKRLTDRLNRVYNSLNKLVRRIKDMRTKRDVAFITFGIALALVISSFQVVINPLNWAAPLKAIWWCVIAIGFTVAIVLIFFAIREMRRFDEIVEEQERERHRTELQAELNAFREGLRQDIIGFLGNKEKTRKRKNFQTRAKK